MIMDPADAIGIGVPYHVTTFYGTVRAVPQGVVCATARPVSAAQYDSPDARLR